MWSELLNTTPVKRQTAENSAISKFSLREEVKVPKASDTFEVSIKSYITTQHPALSIRAQLISQNIPLRTTLSQQHW